jgi:hypothetical protein
LRRRRGGELDLDLHRHDTTSERGAGKATLGSRVPTRTHGHLSILPLRERDTWATGPGASAQRPPGLKKPEESGPLERSETLFPPRGPLTVGAHPQPSATAHDTGRRPPAERAASLPGTAEGLPPPTHPHQTPLLPEAPAEILVPPPLCKDVGPPNQICRRASLLTLRRSENQTCFLRVAEARAAT